MTIIRERKVPFGQGIGGPGITTAVGVSVEAFLVHLENREGKRKLIVGMSTPDPSVAGVGEVVEDEKNLQHKKDLHHHPKSPSQLLRIMTSKK